MNGIKHLLTFTLLTMLLREAWLINPGFRTAITEKGFDYIVQVGLPILEAQLNNIKIPDLHGDYHSPIGTLHWDLTSIHLGNMKIPKAAITTGSTGLTVSASGITISGGGKWHYKTHVIFPVSDSGTVDLKVSSTSLSVTVKIGRDAKGHATLSSSACKFNIGKLDVDFHGGASWLYNLFDSTIADAIKGSLNDQVCKLAVNAINTQGNKALESLPVQVNIDKTALVDYSIVKDPVFNSKFMETEHKGEFMSRTKPEEATFSPVSLPAIGTTTNKMLYIWLTTYIANTAGVVYQKAGILKVQITPDEVPSNIPIKLNTKSFKYIVPALYAKYPEMNMTLFLNATQPPVLIVDPHGANVTVFGEVDVCVYDKNNANKVTPAFNLSVTVYTNATIGIKEENNNPYIIGKANFLGAKFSLKFSSVGNINANLLQNAVNILCQEFVIKELNKYAAAGLQIPLVDGVQLISPQIILGKGFIVVDTDINYKPSIGNKAGLQIPLVDEEQQISPHVILGKGFIMVDSDINYEK